MGGIWHEARAESGLMDWCHVERFLSKYGKYSISGWLRRYRAVPARARDSRSLVPVILDYAPAVTWLQANIPAVTQRVPVTGPFSPTVQRWARIIWAIIRAVIRQASNFRFQRYNHLLAITVWHPSILLIAKPDCSRLVYLISKWLPRWYKTAGPITLLPFILLWVFCQVMSAQFPVAIVGIGCRLPGGSDTKELYYEFLRNKVSII